MNTKKRCTFCRDYFLPEDMIKNGISSVCSEACLLGLRDKYLAKRERRRVHRENKQKFGRRLPAGVRERVRERDHHRCRFCSRGGVLELHHVNYRSQGGPDKDTNLLTLCSEHHQLIHTNKRLFQPAARLVLMKVCRDEVEMTVTQALRAPEELLDEAAVWMKQANGVERERPVRSPESDVQSDEPSSVL